MPNFLTEDKLPFKHHISPTVCGFVLPLLSLPERSPSSHVEKHQGFMFSAQVTMTLFQRQVPGIN